MQLRICNFFSRDIPHFPPIVTPNYLNLSPTTMMKNLIYLFCALILFSACGGGKGSDGKSADSLADSLMDTIPPVPEDKEDPAMAEVKVPKAADGVFYDFVNAFCLSSKYQKQRIVFPLKLIANGKTRLIEERNWHFSRLHYNQEVYTVFFPNNQALNLEKDEKIKKVTVQWFDAKKGLASYYNFDKMNGQWMLTSINEHPWDEDADADFLTFYHNFAASEDFRVQHIAETIIYDGVDPENDDEFEAEPVKNVKIPASAWKDELIPVLPADKFSNIDFGQRLSDDGERMVSVETPSSGFTCRLYFRKNGQTWQLHKIENY